MTEIATATLLRDSDLLPADPAPAAAPAREPAVRGGRLPRWLRFGLTRPGLIISVAFLALVLTACFAPNLLASGNPLTGRPADHLRAPDLVHLFGTDHLGRDVFTRVVHGTALSLRSALVAVTIALVVGGLLGLVAGTLGRWIDEAIMRFVDVLLAIPALLLSLALVTALGYGTVNVAIAVAIGSVATFARVARSETLRVSRAAYVEAARSAGSRPWTTLWRHILPNAIGPILALAVLEFGVAILAVASLSFLGYGAPPPTPEWGAMVAEGRNYLATSWWLTTLPGLTVAATVLAVNRVSRALDGEWRRA
ncbi:ABC transporter permease [Cumulibacter manganitolerans]|uniref:ABC transporter permease n=1 Tax=Cumulibacter manganitolerans TaxID=1884992 RepID=UPI00129659C7|nr:ABC transporter permease [Cumulibacter manganitolerans]